LTSVIAVPGSGTTILTGALFEKSAGSGGTLTIKYGTTKTNPCDTGTTTVLGPITNPPIGYVPLGGIVIPAGNAVCIQTDSSSTGARLLYK
jgi:hypothetical protein